jgi:hypothetical protein
MNNTITNVGITPPKNVLLPAAYWAWAGKKPEDGRFAPSEWISKLETNEVFVFGSNADGFHGAGAAGWAFTGKPGNQYRAGNPWLSKPRGTKGAWAVLGQSRGYQEGLTGRSYAIVTVRRPGASRSVPLQEIREQVQGLYQFATTNSQMLFLVPQTGGVDSVGFNGYYLGENANCFLDPATEEPATLPKSP